MTRFGIYMPLSIIKAGLFSILKFLHHPINDSLEMILHKNFKIRNFGVKFALSADG